VPRALRLLVIVAITAARAAAQPAPAAQAPAAAARVEAERVCAAREPSCDWLTTLGSLEQQSVGRALAERKLEIEPAPWGKVIEEVHVYNEDVFAEGIGLIKFFNHFHITTKEHAIRGELVIGAGEPWDQARVEESARRLRDPTYTSVVAIVPVRARDPHKVSMLVVTRDIWSLRLNTQYTFQEGSLTNLNISFSENNFLGQRNTIAAAITMDQGAMAVGPLFVDKNVAGTHAVLSARVDDILTRKANSVYGAGTTPVAGDPVGLEDAHTFHSEGTDSNISLSMPLWQLASEWGWGVSFGHSWSVQRQFYGTQLRGYDDPDTTTAEDIPWEYGLHYWTSSAYGVRQWGSKYKSQFSFGHTVTYEHPYLLPNFPDDPELQMAFERDVFPLTENQSVPYVEYALFEPRYKTLHDVATYDLAEDARYGPSLDVSYGQGLHALGGTYNFERPSLSLGYVWPWCVDGFISASGAITGRYLGGEWIDNTASGTLRFATPVYYAGRLVVQSSLATRWHDKENAFYAIGSDSGLRGFVVNEFIGQRRFSTIVEARTTPIRFWVLRLGGVAFYELGGAANSLVHMPLYDDAGVGLRMLIPQTSRELFRFDFAFPLDGPQPGALHFIAGFDSYF
jgi:hypothetical protein